MVTMEEFKLALQGKSGKSFKHLKYQKRPSNEQL